MGKRVDVVQQKRNIYLSDGELRTILAAVDAMLDTLPSGDDVPEVDRADAERDRADYVLLRAKIEKRL
jgi:hypothetical protein